MVSQADSKSPQTPLVDNSKHQLSHRLRQTSTSFDRLEKGITSQTTLRKTQQINLFKGKRVSENEKRSTRVQATSSSNGEGTRRGKGRTGCIACLQLGQVTSRDGTLVNQSARSRNKIFESSSLKKKSLLH